MQAASVRGEQGLGCSQRERFTYGQRLGGEKLPGSAGGDEQTNSDPLAASCSARCGLN